MSKEDEPEFPTVAATYLSVGDGGLTVQVLDERGPTLEFSTNHFGNLPMSLKVFTTVNGLTALRDMLNKALEHEYKTLKYAYPAKPV